MADTDATPMTDADVTASSRATAAEPLKGGANLTASKPSASDTIRESANKYGAQATDKIRTLADTGKDKATGALTQVSTLLNDAAAQVDEKIGAQYGDYARTAASQISSFSDQLANKNVDDLANDARDFVRKSPAVAIGIAAAVGFALARLVHAGVDNKA